MIHVALARLLSFCKRPLLAVKSTLTWADYSRSKPLSNGKVMPSSLKDKIMASDKFQTKSDEEHQRHG